MKRPLLLIVLISTMLVPSAVFGMASFDFPEADPVLSHVEGSVLLKKAKVPGWETAEVGRLLRSGDTIRTEASSKAEISFATGKVRLYENTAVIIPEVVDEGDKRDIRWMDLDEGTSLFKIKKRGVEKGFEVLTSNIAAGVKGTLFAVTHVKKENYSRVAVYVGVVEVTDIDRTPETRILLRRGDFVEIKDRSGFEERGEFGPDDVWYWWEKLDSLVLKPPKPPREEPSGDGHSH
jgi:ferric-dicitrate binding protein FerR (iron transport regulator)